MSVSRDEFYRQPVALLLPYLIAYCGAVTWALRHERLWARPLMAVAWPRYDTASDPYLNLRAGATAASAALRTKYCDFWESLR